jgi:methylthioribulose-1-phosphate dehydratase
MTPEKFPAECKRLCDICDTFGARGWCRATSGNFSLRIDDSYCLITRSGKEKSRLTPNDLMICDLSGEALDTACRPSAETPLHTRLYQLDGSIGAVLHTHSVPATMLSRSCGSHLTICGFEMQKAFTNIESHETELAVPIYDNNQDMHALADVVGNAWSENAFTVPGFLIRGHGLYAWGKNSTDAQRHVEGFEFLFECLWQESLAQRS